MNWSLLKSITSQSGRSFIIRLSKWGNVAHDHTIFGQKDLHLPCQVEWTGMSLTPIRAILAFGFIAAFLEQTWSYF